MSTNTMSPNRAGVIGGGERLPGLDAARFYASTAIILFHLAPLSGIKLPLELAFIAKHFGFAVPLFYVASAFSLTINHHDRLLDAESIKTFYAKRFFRIAPLFYVMIAFYTFLLPMLTGNFVGPDEAIASLFFLFNFLPAYVEGFVWASWSIGVEAIFYLLFPLLLIFASSSHGAAIFFAIAVVAKFLWTKSFEGSLEFVSFGYFFFLPYLMYFAAGMLAFHTATAIHARGAACGWILPASLVALGLLPCLDTAIAGHATAYFGSAFAQTLVQVLWALVLATFTLALTLDGRRLLSASFVCRLGEVSFSTYLWHPVVIYLLSRLGCYDALTNLIGDPLVIFALSAVSTISVCLAVALLSYRLIEVPGMRMRRTVFGGKPFQGVRRTLSGTRQ